MDKIETDCIWVILNEVGLTFFKFMVNRQDKGRFCSESSGLFATIFLSITEFHITIFEFKLVFN